jgi:hypothetical protein
MAQTDSPIQDALTQQLADILRASPRLMRVLQTARDLGLPDWRIASGAVFQTAWNALTGRDPDYGIRDYDLLYFEPDTSWDAEDAVIRRTAAAFEPPLRTLVEVRNQARVHLWFETKFGEPYAPLSCTDEALGRFLCPANAVGVRLEADGRLDIAAPLGLGDLFAMRLRPNPVRPFNAPSYARVTAGLVARWPEATVEAMQAP